MADATTTKTGFDREALEVISGRDADSLVAQIREQAFEQFVTMPVPSPDTEEWRYTDLREFDLSPFAALAEDQPALNLDEVKPDILAAVGDIGDRAGLLIQHNSTVITRHLDPRQVEQGVLFTSIDEAAATAPDLLQARLHDLVPTSRTKFTA